jgi:hypothetical protein
MKIDLRSFNPKDYRDISANLKKLDATEFADLSRELRLDETEDQVTERVTAFILELARMEAGLKGEPFDPNAAEVQERIDLAVAESLDEMGFFQPPADIDA